MMKLYVFGFRHEHQIGDIVVLLVAIDVMNDVAVGNLAEVVRPHRTVKMYEFEVMIVSLKVPAVGDAVELLMRFIDLLDFETIAIDFVD